MDIGRALSGLGAAFKNEVPEFRQRIRQEDLDADKRAQREMLMADRVFDRGLAAEDRVRQLSDRDRRIQFEDEDRAKVAAERRQKTLFLDNRVALSMFENGDYKSVGDLFDDRLGLLPEGVDNRDSARMRGLARAALVNPRAVEELGKELRRIDNFAVVNEVLSAPELPTIVSGSDIDEYGQIIERNPRTGELTSSTVEDFETGSPVSQIPPSLLSNLEDNDRKEAQDLFAAVGGGSDGIKALNELSMRKKERDKSENVGSVLSNLYPDASQEELDRLILTVRQAKDVETGLGLASTLRESQEVKLKGRRVKENALTLAKRILDNKELTAVTGSIQGRGQLGDFRYRNDELETNAIIDINNLRDMLTANNLKMMSGVLSETDIKIIANVAGGGLERQRSPEAFKVGLQEIINGLTLDLEGGLRIRGQETPIGSEGDAPVILYYTTSGDPLD